MTLAQIYKEHKRILRKTEKKIESALNAPHPILHTASLDLLNAGGKRIRPLLAILAAQYGDPGKKEVVSAAASLELIHMASLVHDDVVDDSDIRRGEPTVKAKWDNRVAMYTGDFMFAKAIELISTVDNPEAHRLISKVIRDLSLGEIDQIRDLYRWQQNIRCYLLRIKRKTALLMALSCQLGALAAGCTSADSKKMYYYGYFIGMSYQITDDLLDFTGSEKQLGKPAGSDLRSGNITLPTYFALKEEPLRRRIVALVEADRPDDAAWQDVIDSIKNSEAIARSKEISDLYLRKAEGMLSRLPQKKVTDDLKEIVDYIGARKF